jgi:cyclopropane-fatty-acyl-phospholipid synthase
MNPKLVERFLGRIVKQGVLEIVHPNGTISRLGTPTPGFPEVRVRFADDRVARDLMFDPRLGAGEAFIAGRLIIEQGDVMELATLIRANQPWERRGRLRKTSRLKRLREKAVTLLDGMNRAARAKANVAHHYDIGNDLYRLFLDQEHMQYSCAYWPREDMTLEEAQEAKLAHIAAKLALQPGQRVLDIGCGWGGMAIYLARKAGVSVLGITLSEEQLTLARERAHEAGVTDSVEFELVDYRDLAKRGDRFDRIVSVGMFEHVGQAQFNQFFRACANMLSDDGAMLLHTIGRLGGPGVTDAFTRKYIFPGGYIPALSETLAASERFRMIATDVETLRLHYARTLREWYKRTVAHKEQIEALYDPSFYRMWCFYLAGATSAFESGGLCNYQIQYARNRSALPLARDYIGEAERELLASTSPQVHMPARSAAGGA